MLLTTCIHHSFWQDLYASFYGMLDTSSFSSGFLSSASIKQSSFAYEYCPSSWERTVIPFLTWCLLHGSSRFGGLCCWPSWCHRTWIAPPMDVGFYLIARSGLVLVLLDSCIVGYTENSLDLPAVFIMKRFIQIWSHPQVNLNAVHQLSASLGYFIICHFWRLPISDILLISPSLHTITTTSP